MMRINSHRMPCFRVTYRGKVKKVVKAPDAEAVRAWVERSTILDDYEVIQIRESASMDTDSGAHVAVDWQGKVLRLAQHVDREEF